MLLCVVVPSLSPNPSVSSLSFYSHRRYRHTNHGSLLFVWTEQFDSVCEYTPVHVPSQFFFSFFFLVSFLFSFSSLFNRSKVLGHDLKLTKSAIADSSVMLSRATARRSKNSARRQGMYAVLSWRHPTMFTIFIF